MSFGFMKATEDIERFLCVEQDTAADFSVKRSLGVNIPLGFNDNKILSGDAVDLRSVSGMQQFAVAGGTVARGDALKASTVGGQEGRVITLGSGTSGHMIAKALEAAVVGEIFKVMIERRSFKSTL